MPHVQIAGKTLATCPPTHQGGCHNFGTVPVQMPQPGTVPVQITGTVLPVLVGTGITGSWYRQVPVL